LQLCFQTKDLEISRLAAPIHAVAPLAYIVVTWLPARLPVSYSQWRSIFSSATAFTTATLHWQQSWYSTITRKKIKNCNSV